MAITALHYHGYVDKNEPEVVFLMDDVSDVANLPTDTDAKGVALAQPGCFAYTADLTTMLQYAPTCGWVYVVSGGE